MLFLVQFPYADLRPFRELGTNGRRQARPDWSVPPRRQNPDFLRGVGVFRKRTSFVENDQVVWPGEGWYATARRGLWLPLIDGDFFRDARFRVNPNQVVRRIYSNGAEVWRLEIGVGCSLSDDVSLRDILEVGKKLLETPVRVRGSERLGRRRGTLGAPAPGGSIRGDEGTSGAGVVDSSARALPRQWHYAAHSSRVRWQRHLFDT